MANKFLQRSVIIHDEAIGIDPHDLLLIDTNIMSYEDIEVHSMRDLRSAVINAIWMSNRKILGVITDDEGNFVRAVHPSKRIAREAAQRWSDTEL